MAENGNDLALGYMMGSDGTSGGNSNGGFGGFGEGIWAVIILAILFGRGGFGWGGNDGGNGGSTGFGWMGNAPWATQADVRAAVDQQTLISKLDQQTYGLADSTYALNSSITNGFHGVDNAICNLGFNVQQGFNSIGHQISDCCCQTQRAIDGVNYNMAKGFCDLGNVINMQTRDIIDNQNANYRGLMDFLVQEKLSTKDAQIAQLQNRLSQSEQNGVIRAAIDASTAEIIRRTGNECPVPAYVVPNPNCCYGNPLGVGYNGYGYGYGRDSGCGCGCGCN